MGIAFSDISSLVHPTVGLHSPGEKVSFNLGAQPFAFDIDGLIKTQREARISQLLNTPQPNVSIDGLIRAYLLHYNYGETLAKLDEAQSGNGVVGGGATAASAATDATKAADVSDVSVVVTDVSEADAAVPAAAASKGDATTTNTAAIGAKEGASSSSSSSKPPQLPPADEEEVVREEGPANGFIPSASESAMRYTLPQRKELRELIRMGNVLQAVELVERLYPGLLQRRPYIHFRLRCQQFIELLRKGEAMEAVSYAQGELAPYHESSPSEEASKELADVFSLIAYESPSEAAGGLPARLMGSEHREATADLLNGGVLEEHGVPPTCAIERLLKQLLAVHGATRDANLGFGEQLRLAAEEGGA